MAGVLTTSNFRYASGQIASKQPISVYLRGTATLAQLWQDDDETIPLVNPPKTDAAGNVWFYVSPGEYDYEAFGVRVPFDVTLPAGVDVDAIVEVVLEEIGPSPVPHHQETPAATWIVATPAGVRRTPTVLLDSAPTSPVWTDTEFIGDTIVLTFPTAESGWAYP
jgi:hypothetical protein